MTVLNLNIIMESPPEVCQSFASQNPQKTLHGLFSAGSGNTDTAALTRLTLEMPMGKINFLYSAKALEGIITGIKYESHECDIQDEKSGGLYCS